MEKNSDHKGYYNLLGVSPDASDTEIRKAYLRLTKKYHPDVNPNDKAAEEKFKDITTAYETLKDKKARQLYDAGVSDRGQQGQHYSGWSHQNGFNFENLFEGFFGGGFSRREQRQKRHVQDIECVAEELTLEQAYAGCKMRVVYSRSVNCGPCGGNGFYSAQCQACRGTGFTSVSGVGFFSLSHVCEACYGRGYSACPHCKGQSVTTERKTETVQIPPGVLNNTNIRVKGLGNVIDHGYGDLVVRVRVKKHHLFQDIGNGDLLIKCIVPYLYRLFGGKFQVPCIDGKFREVTIAPSNESKCEISVPGGGLVTGKNLIVSVEFELPDLTKITKEGVVEEIQSYVPSIALALKPWYPRSCGSAAECAGYIANRK